MVRRIKNGGENRGMDLSAEIYESIYIIIISLQLWESGKIFFIEKQIHNLPTEARFRSKTTFNCGKGDDWGSS